MSNLKLADKVSVSLQGRFQLKVNRDPKKFRLTNINSFVPFGKKPEDRKRFITKNGEVDALIIDKLITSFQPEINELDKINIEVLCQHPDVMIAGMSNEEWQSLVKANLKRSNPKFTLTNIDRVAMVEYDAETELIEARGLLYSKKNPISVEKLKWLCSTFGLSYKSNITDEKRYKMFLIKTLDKFIQDTKQKDKLGRNNIELFVEALDNIKKTEFYYYINELKALDIIVDFGGILKIGNRPIGPDNDSVIRYYEDNPKLFQEHKALVING